MASQLPQDPPRDLLDHAAAATGGRPVVGIEKVAGRSSAQRWILEFSDGSTVFVKRAVDDKAAGWLRNEYVIYSSLAETFLPRILCWHDDGVAPFLILEDLGHCYWPPPWSDRKVEETLATMSRVAATRGLQHQLKRLPNRSWMSGWEAVEKNPDPFLRLGLCSVRWFERALPSLLAAQAQVNLDGEDLIHFDVRSDNLCFDGSRVILVDWNYACVGDSRFDIAKWLPSLHVEGGPPPERIMPHAPEYASFMSGFWACRAWLPPPAAAPDVRPLQLRLLVAALQWAIRTLNLPPLDSLVPVEAV